MKTTTTLVFPSFDQLWEFKKLTNTKNCNSNSVLLSLSAEFNEAQVQSAIANFGAVLQKPKVA